MIEGLQSSDPEAIWVLQGWLFSYSSFWKDPTLIQAYLSKIDEKSIIILDLYSEVWPIYNKTNSYFGKPYIWNELHDFGGNLGLYGKIPTLIDEPFKALYTPNSSLVGVGITMEGIYQNMIVYDLVLDIAWMEHSIDPMLWIKDYIKSRYGTINEESYSAWFLLLDSVYNCSDNRRDVTTSLIEKRPNLNFVNNLYYNPKKVIKAARKLIGFAIDRKEKCTEGLLFDITDVSRQVLSDLFSDYYYKDLLISVKNKDLNRYIETSVKMIEIIDDLDILLGTRKEFLLGNWIKDAEKWGGDNENDTRHYRFNAINQITMWGPTSNINDYASKQWNGLMKSYYYVRWCRFFEEILKSLNDGKEFDQIAFDGSIGEFEIDWNYNYNEIFSGETLGGSVDIASMLWEKYDKDFDRFK